MTNQPSPTFTRTGRIDPDDHEPADGGLDETEQPRRRAPDPDLEPAPPRSTLDELRDELAAELAVEVESESIDLPVPGRPGYVVRFTPAIEYDEITAWEKRCQIGKGAARHTHALRLARIVLANTCEQIIRHGDELVTEGGEPLTFRSDAFLDLLDADRATAAVQRFYGRDTDVTRAAGKVLEAAGYIDDGTDLDDEWTTEEPRTPLAGRSPRSTSRPTPD